MLFGKPQSFLGVDLGAGGVKLVELKKEKNRPVLFTYALTQDFQNVHQIFSEAALLGSRSAIGQKLDKKNDDSKTPEPNDIDQAEVTKYADILKEVAKQARTRSKTAVVSLPVSAVFHTFTTLPLVSGQEFETMLKAEVRKLLPYPLEQAVLDYQILHKNQQERTQQVLVNAVPRKLVVFYTAIFKKAGLELDALEPESVALSRSLVGRDSSVSMIVDVGAERTNFFIVENSVPVTHQSIETGGEKITTIMSRALKSSQEATEQIKKDLLTSGAIMSQFSKSALMDLFTPVTDPIIKEIAFSLELFFRQTGNQNKRPEKIILTGGASLLPFFTELIAEKFKTKCYVGDPWGRVVYQDALKPLLHSIGPRMSVAIGLALRNVV